MELPRLTALLLLIGIVASGVAGFMHLEKLGFGDALYLTIQTITTVGYGDLAPRTGSGRLFANFVMIAGVSVGLAFLSLVLWPYLEERMRSMFGLLEPVKARDHVIICGYTYLAEEVVKELKTYDVPFVVVDKHEEVVHKLRREGAKVVVGDPADERTLINAGVLDARALIASCRDDSENAFVTVTARKLREDLPIIVRALNVENIRKLKSAGASHVISPEVVGGEMLGRSVVAPYTALFLDGVGLSRELQVSQFRAAKGAEIVGRPVSHVGSASGASVVALWLPTGKLVVTPSPDTTIEEGAVAVVIGNFGQLQIVKNMFGEEYGGRG